MQETKRPARLKVLEFGNNPGLGLCGKWLCHLGASVTRVDDAPADRGGQRNDGCDLRAADAYLHAGKQVVSLVLDDPGQEALRRQVAQADVFITSLDAPRLSELGLDFATVRTQGLLAMGRIDVVADASFKAYDLQAMALSGLLHIVGRPDRPPLPIAGPQASYSAGLSLLSGLMFCIHASGRDRQPREVVTSAVRAGVYLDWKSQIYCEAEGKVLQRGSDKGPIVIRCADGYVGYYYRPADWANVKKVLGGTALDDERFATQAERDRHRDALREAMEGCVSGRTRQDVYLASQAVGIPVGAVLTLADALRDPQYAERQMWELLDVPGFGPLRAPAVPWTVNGDRPRTPAAMKAATAGEGAR